MPIRRNDLNIGSVMSAFDAKVFVIVRVDEGTRKGREGKSFAG